MKRIIIAAFIVFLNATVSYADDIATEIVFQKTDIGTLTERFPYLKDVQKEEDKFIKDFPTSLPLEIYTATIHDTKDKRDLFLIQQTGSYWCGVQNCPLSVYDVTKSEQPQLLLDVSTPPFISFKECPKEFNLLLPGKLNNYNRWTLADDEFKHIKTYATKELAAGCGK